MDTNKLIKHLIREELRNKWLMFSLEELGFDCSPYTIAISRIILELAGFENRPDVLYLWYDELIDKVPEEITFWNMETTLEKWSEEIFAELQNKNKQ